MMRGLVSWLLVDHYRPADQPSELNPNANQTWNWDEMFKYMKKAETFTAPPNDIQQEMGMVLDNDYHGESGPVQIG